MFPGLGKVRVQLLKEAFGVFPIHLCVCVCVGVCVGGGLQSTISVLQIVYFVNSSGKNVNIIILQEDIQVGG